MSGLRFATILLALWPVMIGPRAAAAVGAPRVAGESVASIPLVWHVEASDGTVLDSSDADVPVNPASVVKIATTLWALERLGPGHRFVTRFALRGSLDSGSGVLDGDLLVLGGGDPDFHVENAYLVAQSLLRTGVREVRGKLLVDGRFWIGWEGGSERPSLGTEERAVRMATRLRGVLDPDRRGRRTRRLIQEFTVRNGQTIEQTGPSIDGGVGFFDGMEFDRLLLTHRSNPLRITLKRFNAYSNNDIERLGQALGPPDELAAALAQRWADGRSGPRLETLSGLGANRMTARHAVRLVRDLDRTCDQMGLELEDLLPVAGCDPGTLTHFPALESKAAAALVAKTGTLVHTDGGIAAIAGVARTRAGDRYFFVAAPRAGRRLAKARAAEERWVLDLIDRNGGPRRGECGADVGYSDEKIGLESVQPSSAGRR